MNLRDTLRASLRMLGKPPETLADRRKREAQAKLHAIVTAKAKSPEVIRYRQNRAAGKLGWRRRNGEE